MGFWEAPYALMARALLKSKVGRMAASHNTKKGGTKPPFSSAAMVSVVIPAPVTIPVALFTALMIAVLISPVVTVAGPVVTSRAMGVTIVRSRPPGIPRAIVQVTRIAAVAIRVSPNRNTTRQSIATISTPVPGTMGQGCSGNEKADQSNKQKFQTSFHDVYLLFALPACRD